MRNIKEETLKGDLKRHLVLWQLFRESHKIIKDSEIINEWAKKAKENGNKSFINISVLSAEQLRYMDSYMLRMKKSMQPTTWNAVMKQLNGDIVREISLLIEAVTDIDAGTIEGITRQVLMYKQQDNGK